MLKSLMNFSDSGSLWSALIRMFILEVVVSVDMQAAEGPASITGSKLGIASSDVSVKNGIIKNIQLIKALTYFFL